MGNSRLVGPRKLPSVTNNGGIWSLEEQYYAIKTNSWVPLYVTSGLLAHLDAGNISSYPGSGSTFTDLTGNGNNFTIAGGMPWTSAGTGSYFTSTSDTSKHIIKNPISFPTTAVTYEVWMTADTANSGGGGIVSYASPVTGADNEGLLFDPGNINMYGPSGASVATGQNIIGGAWKQVVFTSQRNSGESKLYINGSLASTQTLNAGVNYNSGGSIVLGQEQDAVGGGFDNTQSLLGKIGSFLLYNKALSAAEVTTNYNAFKSKYGL
jgi:hypothetical protein